jgi:hypothetical protein
MIQYNCLLLIIIYVFIIDFIESIFTNTRKVHCIHNFPDILRMNFPDKPNLKTFCLAGWSGVKVSILPLLLVAIILFMKSKFLPFTNKGKNNFSINLVNYGFIVILCTVIYNGFFNTHFLVNYPFLIHQLMYILSALVILTLFFY